MSVRGFFYIFQIVIARSFSSVAISTEQKGFIYRRNRGSDDTYQLSERSELDFLRDIGFEVGDRYALLLHGVAVTDSHAVIFK